MSFTSSGFTLMKAQSLHRSIVHHVLQQHYNMEKVRSFCHQETHTPIFTDVDESDGVCPDRNKHPPMPGQSFLSAWSGITTTSGEGNDWYRRQNQGQT
ncbi:hypothetical protein AC578_6222 [Pseudocercospora eumusae]|uniref:Uncharacterized protein n=1 Tax=Pseudocercospora eumusae TaxID=321146 RepID=A0A139H355_9PEZI|nr:hypothetical protein AC578_6222 [Pseudocercospora eumusae]